MVDNKNEINEEELEKVDGGLSFATRTCVYCGSKVAVTYVQEGIRKICTSGKCKCGYNFVTGMLEE